MPRQFSYWLVLLAFIDCWICTTQQMSEEDVIRKSFLSLFGLKKAPQINSDKLNVPDTLKSLYRLQTDYEYDTASLPLPGMHTQNANTVRSFTHVDNPIDAQFPHHHRFRLKFNIASIPATERLKAAELKLNRVICTSGPRHQRILVEDILRPGRKGVHAPLTRLIDSVVIDTRRNETIGVDVFPAVQRWLENSKSNYGILVSVRGSDGVGRKPAPEHHVRLRRQTPNDLHQPLLITYTDDGTNIQNVARLRKKRASRRTNRKGDQRDPCKRRPMYVNFRDVGWSDWIVAPLGYDAFYCEGACEYPMAEHMNTTNHAIVQSLMNSARPNEVPKPCCVPTQLSSMSMLYVDQDNSVILKNYKEMVVIGCGCR